MTKIIYDPDELDLLVEGHAQSGKKGEDLVCAAISALTMTLEATLKVQDSIISFVLKNQEKARFHAYISPKSPLRAQAMVIFETIATGLLALAEEYPEFVQFDIKEEEEAKEKDDLL